MVCASLAPLFWDLPQLQLTTGSRNLNAACGTLTQLGHKRALTVACVSGLPAVADRLCAAKGDADVPSGR